MTGLSHYYILEALDIELLFRFVRQSCVSCPKQKTTGFFSSLFSLPKVLCMYQKKRWKKKGISSGEWIVYKVKDPILHVLKSQCNLSVGLTPHFSVYWWYVFLFCVTSISIALFLTLIPLISDRTWPLWVVSYFSDSVVLCFFSKQFWNFWAVRPRSQCTNDFLNWPGCTIITLFQSFSLLNTILKHFQLDKIPFNSVFQHFHSFIWCSSNSQRRANNNISFSPRVESSLSHWPAGPF